MKRLILLVLFLCVSRLQFTACGQVLTTIPNPSDYVEYTPTGISPNGRYLIASRMQTSPWSYNYNIHDFIIDLQTWQETEAIYLSEYRYCTFQDVNNYGNACGTVSYDEDKGYGKGYGTPAVKDGNYYAKAITYIYSSDAAVTTYGINDNKTIVGTIQNSQKYEPIVITADGITNLPIPSEVVNDLSEYTVAPLSISNDEQTIIGYASFGRYIPLKWTRKNGNYVCMPLAVKYVSPVLDGGNGENVETPYTSFSISNVSDNMEWISGTLTDKEGKNHIARYNVNNDSFDLLESENIAIYSACPITDSGTMIARGTTEDGNVTGYYWNAGSSSAVEIKKCFPILSDYKSVSIAGISSDGRTILGVCDGCMFVLSEAVASSIGQQAVVGGNKEESGFYNLNGCKIKFPKTPGIYIHNGKKIVIK